MINDLICCIQQEDIRQELLNACFDTVICYPGSGADMYPCAVIEKIDSAKLGIPDYKDKTILYLFCDPNFSQGEGNGNSSLYRDLIINLNGKRNLGRDQLISICKSSGLYINGYKAYKNIDEMFLFARIGLYIEKEMEGYFYKIVIDNKICNILLLSCSAQQMWEICEGYKISVDGAFLWDIQSWSMRESIKNISRDYLPKWIIGNRHDKYGGYGKVYTYAGSLSPLICPVRGVDAPEPVTIHRLSNEVPGPSHLSI